jgi:hypothetical protein
MSGSKRLRNGSKGATTGARGYFLPGRSLLVGSARLARLSVLIRRTSRNFRLARHLPTIRGKGPAIRECHHSPCERCDSSLCFIATRTRSSEERVLSTATLRTMLPFNPVSPACFDPLTVMM